MAIKLKAKEQKQYVGKYAGTYRYVMTTELYNKLTERKVLAEAAMRSGISQGTINAAWAAIGEVIKAWATEGHSVAVPGLGTMRFGVRATSVADVSEVSSSLITSRRVIFTPSTDIKDELASTSINITCYDRDGNIVKRVTSTDDGEVEDDTTRTEGEEGGEYEEESGEEGAEMATTSETKDMYAYEKTSMVDDKARVVKGGSWKDRAFYLSPGQRRFLDQAQATDWIGFRCAMDRLGAQRIEK